MKTAIKDFEARNNSPWLAELVLSYRDGTAFDLSVYDGFSMEVKSDPYMPEPEATPSVTLSSGALRISAAVADIQYLDGLYQYDIVGLVAGLPVDTLVVGTIAVTQGI